MHTKGTYDVGDMPSLKSSLGKHGTERVAYKHNDTKSKRGKNIENTVIDEMQGRLVSVAFCGVNDIIAGVCRLDHYNQKDRNTPLSQNRMLNILQTMNNINTREVMVMMDVSARYARYYVKASELAIRFIEEHFEEEYNDFLVVDDGT